MFTSYNKFRILYARAAGVTHHNIQSYNKVDMLICDGDGSKVASVGLQDIIIICVILLMGVCVSMIFALIEVIYDKVQTWKNLN